MPKYVELDKVVTRLDEHYETLGKKYGFDDMYVRGYGEAINDMEDEPEADVPEVKHGHWMLSDETDVWKCSECGHLTSERIFKQYRDTNGNTCYQPENPFYCSLCGAKMDL